MKKIALLLFCVTLAAFTLSIQSCVKKGNDEPENQTGYDPQIPVTHTIAQLLAMPTYQTITEDVVVAGVVVMDDRSGNYYKKFVIQDSTGGIEINLDQNNIYNDFPVGRKVYLKCKGLSMGLYGGMTQLGYGIDERMQVIAIPFVMAEQYIVKANYPNEIKIDTFTYDQLANPAVNGQLLNKLVAIKEVEFATGHYGVTYAAPNATTNRNIVGCSGASGMVVRTSNYSRFQGNITPRGSGVIVGLYTKYNSTAQIILRDTTDVIFGATRCDGSTPTPPVAITIDSLRNKFTAGNLNINNLKITGTVISDRSNGNVQSKNLIIQQGQKGIMIRFTADHTFNLGDSIEVNLTGATFEEFNGLLQINNTPASGAIKVGTGTIIPKLITLSDLDANFESNESILVKIVNVTLPSGTFAGNQVINDGTGSIIMYTSSGASFAGSTMPTGSVSVTGVVGQFNTTKQIQIRKLADIQ